MTTWGPIVVVVLVLLGVRWLLRAHERNLEAIDGLRRVSPCTRDVAHDGPCNGWPCESARLRMEGKAVDRRQPRVHGDCEHPEWSRTRNGARCVDCGHQVFGEAASEAARFGGRPDGV